MSRGAKTKGAPKAHRRLAGWAWVGLAACQAQVFVERPAGLESSYLAVLQLGPEGNRLRSTALSPPGVAITAEQDDTPEARTLLYAFAPERVAALLAVAERAGLDGAALQAQQPVEPASGCAPRYPGAEGVYELFEDRWVRLEDADAAPELTAPWLLESCEPAVEPPAGFVSSVALASSCGACPSDLLEPLSACVYQLRTDGALCSSRTEEVRLRRDWRDEVCVEEATTCRSTGGATFRCGAEPDVCELELHFQTYREEDRFAVSEEVAEAAPGSSSDYISTPGFSVGTRRVLRLLNRHSFAVGRCEDRSTTRLDLFDLASAELERTLQLPGCVTAVAEGRGSESILFISVSPEEVFHLIEVDLEGEELARTLLEPRSALGLSGSDAATASYIIPWPAQDGWVAGFSQVGRRTRPGVLLFFRGVGAGQEVTFGPRFMIPEGGFPTRILEAGPSGPGLYLLSGGNWAFAASPTAPILFESLGGFGTRFPSPRDLGVSRDGRVWIVGGFGQSPAAVPLEPGSTTRAFVSEVAGSAAVLAPWGAGLELVLSSSGRATYATRFDARAERFLPGTLTLETTTTGETDQLLTARAAPDGSVWALYRDGRMLRITEP